LALPELLTVALAGEETYTPATAGRENKVQAAIQKKFPVRIESSGRYLVNVLEIDLRARKEQLSCLDSMFDRGRPPTKKHSGGNQKYIQECENDV